ncbi:MAG: beta-galactosidase, partial [Phycisphaerae bacterium]
PAVLTERPVRYEFTDKTGWYPFNFPLNDTNLDRIDLTGFLDPPAGKHGFLTVRGDGHFQFADGTRGRFFGTNICGPHAFPEKKDAPAIAARLAKYGVNMLRIHAVDGQWGGLIDYGKGDSRHFNADALDRLDYLFAELKKRGTYVYFDLLDYRRFLPGDGVQDAEKFQHGWRNSIKGATIFNDRLIELQKEFATNFLTHANPYTKLRYVDDPAVAVVEITNENSVFYLHNTSLTLPCYVEELRERWNRWLLERYGSRAKLAAAWTSAGRSALLADEDPARNTVHIPLKDLYSEARGDEYVGHRSPLRIRDMRRFLFDIERRYYGQMRGHLKSIGVKVPITGTNQTFCPASNFADACNDFMSRNNYWLHPNVHAKPFVTFRNLAVVNSDLARTSNPITEIASSSVAGKPIISPEFNFPWPNEFRAECLPLMAAYACFQDWDGLLFFSYRPGGDRLEHFGNQSDPVRWGQFPAAAMIFHRRDVAAALNTVYVSWPQEDTFAPRRTHRQAESSPFRLLPYITKVRNLYKAKEQALPELDGPARLARRYASDTGELTLDSNSGLFTMVTPRAKAAVGFLGQLGPVDLKGVTVECQTPFAAVLVTSLDARPISSSGRIFVTAVARAENTGQAFCRNRSAIPEMGRPPVLAEPVLCRLSIQVLGRPTAYCLDETGKRRNQLPADFDGNRLRLRTDSARTPWIEIAVAEPSP